MNVEQARFNMIEQQIRPWNVLDPNVLELLSLVRREEFVPPAHRALAFADVQIPLGEGQFMLAPRLEARMLQEAQVQRHERVFEVGAGSGFVAALLAHRARSVVSAERRPALARMAAVNLERAGISNVSVREADASTGPFNDAPFDVVVMSGSVASVPQVLLDQVAPGGRLIAIVGHEPVMRCVIMQRLDDGTFSSLSPFDTVAPRLEHFAEASAFSF